MMELARIKGLKSRYRYAQHTTIVKFGIEPSVHYKVKLVPPRWDERRQTGGQRYTNTSPYIISKHSITDPLPKLISTSFMQFKLSLPILSLSQYQSHLVKFDTIDQQVLYASSPQAV